MNRSLAILLLSYSGFVCADPDIKQEIISRCRSQMGQYGASIVKACVDQDLDSLPALVAYQKSHKEVFNRCYSQMKEHGYSIVKACIDQDVEAEAALSRY